MLLKLLSMSAGLYAIPSQVLALFTARGSSTILRPEMLTKQLGNAVGDFARNFMIIGTRIMIPMYARLWICAEISASHCSMSGNERTRLLIPY